MPRAQSSDRSSRIRRARHPGCGGGRRSSSRAARAAHARSCAQTAGARSAAARRRPRGGAQRTRGRGQTHRCSVGAMRGSGACYASAAGRVTACHEPRGRLMVGGGARAAARALARYHVHTAPQVFIHVHQLKSPVKFRPNALHDAHRPPTSHQSHRPPAGRPVLWANGRWWQVGRGANLSAGHPSRPLKTAQAHISQK